MSAPPPRRPITDRRVLAVRGERRLELPDQLVTEEPMEIRVAAPGRPAETVAVTMRTPGHDFDLAVGFLLSEGVIEAGAWVRAVRYCDPDGRTDACADDLLNTVTVDVDRPVDIGLRRIGAVSSSCGVCGSASLDGLVARCRPLGPGAPFSGEQLMDLPERLRAAQRLFGRTGGLHGAGLFTRTGASLAVREDIGRHNAVDKLAGWAALGRVLLSDAALVVSGRVSFEIVQKAAVAGVPVIVAVSAASSLAVETAERLGVCLVGFARGASANVYSRPERISWEDG